jgi:hypothetical protein
MTTRQILASCNFERYVFICSPERSGDVSRKSALAASLIEILDLLLVT